MPQFVTLAVSERAYYNVVEYSARARWGVIVHGGHPSFKNLNMEYFDFLQSNNGILLSKSKTLQIKTGSAQSFQLLGTPEDSFSDSLDIKPFPEKEDWAHWHVLPKPIEPTKQKYWFEYELDADHLKVSIGKPVAFNIQVEWRSTGADFNVTAVAFEIDASQVLDNVRSWVKNVPLPRDLLVDPLVFSSGLFGTAKKGLEGKKIIVRMWFNGKIDPELQLISLVTVATTILTTLSTIRVAAVREGTPFLVDLCDAKSRLRTPLPRTEG